MKLVNWYLAIEEATSIETSLLHGIPCLLFLDDYFSSSSWSWCPELLLGKYLNWNVPYISDNFWVIWFIFTLAQPLRPSSCGAAGASSPEPSNLKTLARLGPPVIKIRHLRKFLLISSETGDGERWINTHLYYIIIWVTIHNHSRFSKKM